MFWEENERTGYRHVSVEYDDRVLMAVTAHREAGEWSTQVIPMGFSFSYNEVQTFSFIFSVLPGVMDFLCTDTLNADEVQNYLDSIGGNV
jgi:hypothetical protein